MTLCIAAHANYEGQPRIVICFDLLVGNDLSMSESAWKCDLEFAPGLVSPFAGRVDDAEDATRMYRERLAVTPPTLSDIKEQLWAGMEEFKDALRRQGRKSPQLQLVVAGFIEGEEVLLYLDSRQVVSSRQYQCIGCGAPSAEAMLRWRNIFPVSLYDALYLIYEAKRFGETSPFVGKRTVMFVLEPATDRPERPLRVHPVDKVGIDFLASRFEALGPRPYQPIVSMPEGSIV
jgi:hypothetical protein